MKIFISIWPHCDVCWNLIPKRLHEINIVLHHHFYMHKKIKKKCAINSCYNSFNYLHNWMAENAQRNIISICKLELFFWNGRVCLNSFQSPFDKLSVVKKQVIALPDEIIGSAQHRSWCTQKVIHCYFFFRNGCITV